MAEHLGSRNGKPVEPWYIVEEEITIRFLRCQADFILEERKQHEGYISKVLEAHLHRINRDLERASDNLEQMRAQRQKLADGGFLI